MATARENSEEPKQRSKGKLQYIFFDHSNHSITPFYSKTQTHFCNSNSLKHRAVNAVKRARAERTNSLVLETLSSEDSPELSEISAEDSDMKSDRESLCHEEDVVEDSLDNEQCIDELLYNEGTRKKLKLLAGMVGVDSTEPGVVLAEVVRIVKDLKRRNQCDQLSK